jgi:hypothetical protein
MDRGDFHGEETLILESEHLSIEVLADAGPRIVRLRLAGSDENVLGEVAGVGWDTPWGHYKLRGGHRLWCAPERPPFSSTPDEGGLKLTETATGLSLERLEPETGICKRIAIEPAGDRAAVTVSHTIRNEGAEVIEQAPWAITIFPLGGTAILPQQKGPIGESDSVPNRSLNFWSYGSITDPRLELHDDFVLVRSERTVSSPFKIGYLDRSEWAAAYLPGGLLFCKSFDVQPERRYADLDSNVEAYCDGHVLELETMGPLALLEPGDETSHEERWEIHHVGEIELSAERLDALVVELGLPG